MTRINYEHDNSPPTPGGYGGSMCLCKDCLDKHHTCKKCGGKMKESKAIQQTWVGIPDFPGDDEVCTVSPGGPGKLVDCLKCEDCGWSVTV